MSARDPIQQGTSRGWLGASPRACRIPECPHTWVHSAYSAPTTYQAARCTLSILLLLAAGFQEKPPVLGLFLLLDMITTILIGIHGISLFLLFRAVQLAACILYRNALVHVLVST